MSRSSTAAEPDVGILRPRVNTVTLRKDDLSCMLPRYTGLADDADAATLRRQVAPAMKLGQGDFCAGNASLELNYQIDMFGSKVVTRMVNGRATSTQAGKFFVVTVSPDAEAGAGWHIADDLRRNRDFVSSVSSLAGQARGESLGPLVNRYQFWIKKPDDMEVTLVEKFPTNKDKMVSISESRSLNAGVTGTVTGQVAFSGTKGTQNTTSAGVSGSASAGGSTGLTTGSGTTNSTSTLNQTEVTTGKDAGTKQINGTTVLTQTSTNTSTTTDTNFNNTAGVTASSSTEISINRTASGEQQSQLSGQMQQTNSRQLSYNGTEYVIDNKGSSTMAKWVWDLKLEDDPERICDYLIKRDLNTCLYTLPLIDEGWIINAGKFSAATHANFVPTFQAVFKAAPGFARTSTFEFGASVTLASFLASARPAWSPTMLAPEGNLVQGNDGVMTAASSLRPDVLKFSADLKQGAVQSVTESFTVDWDQPFFAPEQNIRLQVMSPANPNVPETTRTQCLTANYNAQTNASNAAAGMASQATDELRAAEQAATAADSAFRAAQVVEAAALVDLNERGESFRAEYNRAVAARVLANETRIAADNAVLRARLAAATTAGWATIAGDRVHHVSLEQCTPKKEQLWGYDAEEKLFKSRAVKGREYCLAYPNLDRRVVSDDSLVAAGAPNALVIIPCSGMDNRQKWELRADGYLYNAVSSDNKAVGFSVDTVNKLDRYGEQVSPAVIVRVPYTGMTGNGNLTKKFQALPAVY